MFTESKSPMDKIFVRNFVIFFAILTCCVSMFIYYFISGDRALGRIDGWVDHTNKVISEAEHLSSSVQGMIASQRGYLLSQEQEFLEEYERNKTSADQDIKSLQNLTYNNLSQQERLAELSKKQKELIEILESRLDSFNKNDGVFDLSVINTVRDLKHEILEINKSILFEEYALLNKRVKVLQNKKSQYLITLIGGVIIGAALLLIFNMFLLKTQRRKANIEEILKETEDRFALAMQGTEDGIFDWDIENGKLFLSDRYYGMLGYYDKNPYGTVDDIKPLIHPEDSEKLWQYVDQYLNNELSEFIVEFRMKHNEGHWVWVQSRAKALFDNKGRPYRMVGAHTDITHMVLEKQRLERDKEKAEDANRAKGDFLAHMSHEIRTPLTAISGIAEILQRNLSMLDEKHQKLITTLNASAASLKDIVNDVLDFSKIESGDIEIEERLFHIGELFSEVTSMMAVKAQQENINFIFDDSQTKNVDFYGDKIRLRQVLVNLIGNSLKFTEACGLVKITTSLEDRDDGQHMRIDVSDTGIGIRPEDFDSIFERFKQADTSVSRKYGGTGLGLPISNNLVKLMGGGIFLSSKFGEGSTFSVILPMKVEHKPKKTSLDQTKKEAKPKTVSLKEKDNKILLVEDYSGNVVIISFLLDEMNLKYDVANNGQEALDMWSKNKYNLILMDVQMPIMDGFKATYNIREREEKDDLPRTPIIGMTAHALVGDKNKCIEAGMDAYLPKPIVEKDLKDEIFRQLK